MLFSSTCKGNKKAEGAAAGCTLDPCVCLCSCFLSTLDVTMVDSLGAAVMEALSCVAGVSILSTGGGGVFNGSSISIGVTKTLLLKSEAFSCLFESTAADETPR